jgi:NADH:ubiquinone oxidoreductase subunit 4 (subunit M)
MPMVTIWSFLLCLFNISFPLSLNFIEKIFIIIVLLRWKLVLLVMIIIIYFFREVYSLYLYSIVNHGEVNNVHNK